MATIAAADARILSGLATCPAYQVCTIAVADRRAGMSGLHGSIARFLCASSCHSNVHGGPKKLSFLL